MGQILEMPFQRAQKPHIILGFYVVLVQLRSMELKALQNGMIPHGVFLS